jgi:DNA-binding transcriptional regulator YhcF (GntR family)
MLYSIQVGEVPIYRQIVQRITHQVASGALTGVAWHAS